jgi:hypothetical protein
MGTNDSLKVGNHTYMMRQFPACGIIALDPNEAGRKKGK